MSALVLLAVAIAAAPADLAPPGTLSDEVRAVLSSRPIEVARDGKAWLTLWPVKAAPASKGTNPPGAEFASVGSGSLLGVLRLGAGWTDYRGNAVAAGDYTLRYGLLPEDGNHMGVAVWRDFVLLIPAATDRDPAPLAENALLAGARKSAGKPHPAVLSLFPAPDGLAAGAVFDNEVGQPTVVVDVAGIRVGFVVVGEG
jgi:hypothetical protein